VAIKNSTRKWINRHRGKHLCSCGCGGVIEILPIHHKKGIPKFIVGHNFSSVYNPKLGNNLEVKERSAFWEVLTEEERNRRLSMLNRFGPKEKHPRWKGGRVKDEIGYVKIRMPEHPQSKDGYIHEHRYVMEEYLKNNYPNSLYLTKINGYVCLRSEVVVHHIDEDKSNNNIENLFPFPDAAAHNFWHKSSLPEAEKIKRIKLGLYRNDLPREENKNLNDTTEPTDKL
jgi:hypothetical protein